MLTSPTPQESLHEAALIDRAQLLTDLEISVAAVIDELRVMADGRADLLANAAASQIGAYVAAPRTVDPYHLLAGTFRVLAGVNTDRVEIAVEDVDGGPCSTRGKPLPALLERGVEVRRPSDIGVVN